MLCAWSVAALLLTAQGQEDKPNVSLQERFFGSLEPNFGGFKLAETEYGSLSFSTFTYVRYLNQRALDDTYTDSFGRTRELDQRNDIQIQKVKFDFKGWFLDPQFNYFLWVWTSNATMGQGAQVVVAGTLSYVFDPAFRLGAGISALPAVRSLEGSFPRFLKVDNRPMADEFFRGSYATGVWGMGSLAEGLDYKVMLANNLSQLGVDAVQQDGTLDTVSAYLAWLPTTGEYGPGGGMGDLEQHDRAATRLGIHFTHSTEDRQSQPGKEDPENTQLRLSDGTALFDIDALAPGTQVRRARYMMLCSDVGVKYRGFSVEAEYYVRWIRDLKSTGDVPIRSLFDHGLQVQMSYMLTERLMAYASPSKIFGEFGDPWDLSVGVNWYPITRKGFERQLRVNLEVIYLRNSPVGYSSIPYLVGGNGPVFNVTVELFF